MDQVSFASVSVSAGTVAELSGCGGRRCEAQHITAAVDPCLGERPQGVVLPVPAEQRQDWPGADHRTVRQAKFILVLPPRWVSSSSWAPLVVVGVGPTCAD